jgi:hypothetical protein
LSAASSTPSAPASSGVTEGQRINACARETGSITEGDSQPTWADLGPRPQPGQSRSNSLIEVLARVFSSTRFTITAQ